MLLCMCDTDIAVLQTLKHEMVTKIANEYLYELLAGGEPEMLQYLQSSSLDLFMAIITIRDSLLPLMPRPCTTQEMAARPGRSLPVLRAILEEYRLQHSAAAAPKSTETLPRLFSLGPSPSCHWRFVEVDAETLAVLLRLSYPRNHEQRLATFKAVFDLDKYGFLE